LRTVSITQTVAVNSSATTQLQELSRDTNI